MGKEYPIWKKFHCAELPTTVYGIEKYLIGAITKGIDTRLAKKIVQKFGTDTLNIIEEDPDRLLEVEGIREKHIDKIRKKWEERKNKKDVSVTSPK